MPQRRAFFALLLVGLFAGNARADDAYVPPTLSVQLQGGATARSTTLQPTPSLGHVRGSAIAGVSPFSFRLDASFYFLRFLGVEVDGLGDVFTSSANGVRYPSQRWTGRGAIALRYASQGGFTLSGSLGYGLWNAPVMFHAANQAPAPGHVSSHGPVARLGVGLEKGRFDGSLSAIVQVPVGGNLRVLGVEPRLWLGARVWDIAPTASFWLGGDVSALIERGGSTYGGVTVFFALAARVTLHAPRPAPKPVGEGASATEGALLVHVTLPDGSAAKGAMVSLDGAAAEQVDAAGELRVTPGNGSHAVQVTLTGFRQASQRVEVRAGEQTVANVELIAPTGPGRVSGVVRAAVGSRPLAEAVVNVAEQSVRTGADGTYVLEKVGPGPVQVRVDAQGFNASEEVAQVPPEGAATLDFSLEPLGKGSPATVRGLVRSRSGATIKASVAVRGLKQKVVVTAEGRFVVSVPAGEYTFVISAPGHLSQSKKVTLADGEQAIFHCELLTVTR